MIARGALNVLVGFVRDVLCGGGWCVCVLSCVFVCLCVLLNSCVCVCA